MAINAFEGARRILLVIQILWVIAVVLMAWSVQPSAQLDLEVALPGTQATEKTRDCDIGTDAREWVSLKTPKGSPVRVALCFRAQSFPNGSMLVPYRVDEDGVMWGDSAYSRNVSTYTDLYGKSFTLLPAQEAKADAETRRSRVTALLQAVGIAAAGWGVLWLFAWVIGWIVRGFAGIPRGRDTRPQQPAIRRSSRPVVSTARHDIRETAAPTDEGPPNPSTLASPEPELVHRQPAPHAQASSRSGVPGINYGAQLGGWLVLPAMGLVFGSLQMMSQIADGLATSSSRTVVVASFWLLCNLVLCVFFFTRHHWTPALFIGVQVLQILTTGFFVLSSVVNEQMIAELWGAFIGAVAIAAIWVPYFLLSKRVKLTFVR